jgi:hypothetical protein
MVSKTISSLRRPYSCTRISRYPSALLELLQAPPHRRGLVAVAEVLPLEPAGAETELETTLADVVQGRDLA